MLSKNTNIPYFDADDFHPEANVIKMKSGTPLNDDDRLGWLHTLNKLASKKTNEKGAIIACSALKESYRQILASQCTTDITWIVLHGSYELLTERVAQRQGHFFDPDLLQSQLDTFELPDYGLRLDVAQNPNTIVDAIVNRMNEQ